jgi:hypothetical protein
MRAEHASWSPAGHRRRRRRLIPPLIGDSDDGGATRKRGAAPREQRRENKTIRVKMRAIHVVKRQRANAFVHPEILAQFAWLKNHTAAEIQHQNEKIPETISHPHELSTI